MTHYVFIEWRKAPSYSQITAGPRFLMTEYSAYGTRPPNLSRR